MITITIKKNTNENIAANPNIKKPTSRYNTPLNSPIDVNTNTRNKNKKNKGAHSIANQQSLEKNQNSNGIHPHNTKDKNKKGVSTFGALSKVKTALVPNNNNTTTTLRYCKSATNIGSMGASNEKVSSKNSGSKNLVATANEK